MESQSVNKLPEKYSVIAYTDEQKNKLICYLEEHVKNLVYESDSDSVFHIRSSKYFASSSNCKLDGHTLISFEDWERLVKAEKTTYKGQLEGVPNDIVERMMDCQEEQGNNMDASVEYISERILIAIAKKEITHKINKIETKLSKLNDKREKLLERYKSLGR